VQATSVFVRDDDLNVLDDSLRSVMDLLRDLCVPCNYQSVPAQLTPEAADFVRARRAQWPHGVRINQHGWKHAQTLRGQPRYSEFDGGRPADSQRADIARGRERLRELLGDDFGDTVFTPPCHKYDAATLQVLADLGFRVLSAGIAPGRAAGVYYALGRSLHRVGFLGRRVSYHGRGLPGSPLVEVSVGIDVDEDVDAAGRRRLKSAEELWQEFLAVRRVTPAVGVMLHHATYTQASRLAELRRFLERLRSTRGVEFVGIEELAGRFAAHPG